MMPEGRRRAGADGVLVLGMHRSGTSVVAGSLHLLGLATCSPDDLMTGMPWNPSGHWESRSLSRLNDELLADMGRSWWYPPPSGPDVHGNDQPAGHHAGDRGRGLRRDLLVGALGVERPAPFLAPAVLAAGSRRGRGRDRRPPRPTRRRHVRSSCATAFRCPSAWPSGRGTTGSSSNIAVA